MHSSNSVFNFIKFLRVNAQFTRLVTFLCFISPPEKKNALMPFPCWQTVLMPFLNCWLASMPLQFNNVWRQFYVCPYKTAVPPMVLILHPECTISLIFRYFDVGWCLSRCKSGQSTRFWKFCESRRLCLRKNWCFGSKCSVRALFKISRKLFITFSCMQLGRYHQVQPLYEIWALYDN